MEIDGIDTGVPAFLPKDPDLWFLQLESTFAAQKIAHDSIKFHVTISRLDPPTLFQVQDILRNPPSEGKFDFLKAEIIKRLSISETHRLQQLLSSEQLGSRRPSQMLREMQRLLGEKVETFDKGVFRQLFLQRLPSHVQGVLAAFSSDMNLDKLAEAADKMLETMPPVAPVEQADSTRLSRLEDMMESVVSSLAKLTADQITHRSQANRSPSSRRRSFRPRSKSPRPTDICFYHHRFGDSARKCAPPCKKAGNFQGGH